MKKTKLIINPDREIGTIPGLFFGQFLEYMYDCIDPGLWAELLHSRGFEDPDGGRGLSAPWEYCGSNIFGCIDSNKVYAPDQSQYLENGGNGFAGIQQGALCLESEGLYEGYLWAYCENDVTVKVRLLSSEKNVLFDKEYYINRGNWQCCKYLYQNKQSVNDATIQYLIDGGGRIWLDQTSLRPHDTYAGVWREVAEQICRLKPTVMRFPGGCAADCYFWEDGIGPRDKRPARQNRHWGGVEKNQFGTDEFMRLCRKLECEPLICINFGSSTPTDAANWVEYCNGGTDTIYGNLRAENGHPEPYCVKYWEIGNETYGSWEIGHCSAEEYIERYLEFSNAMKERDPSIKLLVCGGDGSFLDQEWNEKITARKDVCFDALTLHLYAPLKNPKGYGEKQVYLSVTAAAVKMEKVLQAALDTLKKSGREAPIAITEWNCNYGEEEKTGREQTLEAVIANAGILNMFLRHSENICMTIVSDLINGWAGGIIRSLKGKAFGTGTFHLLQMYAQSRPETVIESRYDYDTYDVPAFGNIGELKEVPFLDIVCCKNAEKEVIVFAVNRHAEEAYRMEIPGWEILKMYSIWNEDIMAKNSFEKPFEIAVKEEAHRESEALLRPHGVYLLCIDKRENRIPE